MNDAITPKRSCVVVDTCVWRAEPLLKTPLGITFVYTLSRRNAVLGLPEIVEIELKNQIVEAGTEAVNKAKGPLQILRTITDNHFFPIDLLNDVMLEKHVVDRLNELDSLLVRMPFTEGHARAALAMVNAKLPPNGEKNQQFKDSAIWQAVLSLSKEFSVVLLTIDKAFFCDREPAKGLAKNLIKDCAEVGVTVNAYEGIGPYLKALTSETPTFDRDILRELIITDAKSRLAGEAERLKITPTELLDETITGFATEEPDRIAIDYTLTFKLAPVSPEFRIDKDNPQGVVHGSCYFLRQSCKVTDHYIQRVAIKSIGSLMARSFRDYNGSFPFPRPLPWDTP